MIFFFGGGGVVSIDSTILGMNTEVLKTQAHIPLAIRVMMSSCFSNSFLKVENSTFTGEKMRVKEGTRS